MIQVGNMDVNASENFNLSHDLAVVPIEEECADMQVIDTNDSMTGRIPHETVVGSGNNNSRMLQSLPNQSQAVVLCEILAPTMTDWKCTRGLTKGIVVCQIIYSLMTALTVRSLIYRF